MFISIASAAFLCIFFKLFVIHLAQSVDQFFADLQLIFSIGLDNDVCSCLIFFSTFFHQFCNKRYGLVVFDQRTVMAVFDTIQNRLRFCGQ